MAAEVMMEVFVHAEWYGEVPDEFKHDVKVIAEGHTQYTTEQPRIKITHDYMTIGKYVIRLNNPRQFIKALEAVYTA